VALWFGDNHDVYRAYAHIEDLVGQRYRFLIQQNSELTAAEDQETALLHDG